MSYEETIIGIIVNGGNARSKAMEAIHHAKTGDIAKAKELLKESSEELGKAHSVQTSLIQSEAGGEKQEVTLLMVHAQDHLMNAMTVRDLAEEIIEMHIKFAEMYQLEK